MRGALSRAVADMAPLNLWPGTTVVLAACLAFVAILLDGCGESERTPSPPHPHHYGEPPSTHATPAPEEHRQRPTTVWGNASSHNGTPTLPPSTIYVCPSLHFEGPNGRIDIEGSRSGESPIVHCPRDYEYKGPRIGCSWVDRVCMVFEGQGPEDVTPDLCQNQYNLTFKGAGLTSWPDGVSPTLVYPPAKDQSPAGDPFDKRGDGKQEFPSRRLRELPRDRRQRYGKRDRNTTSLPVVVNLDGLKCEPEDYVDLDFEAAKVLHSYPPYSSNHPWKVHYQGIAAWKGKSVDMLVTRVDSVDAPGNALLDGNSSSTGRINVNSTYPAKLRFQFIESKTKQPISMNKVYFTIFDVEDGFDGTKNKEVNISGFVEYFVANDTRLNVVDCGDGLYGFGGQGDVEPKLWGDVGVKEMWQNSLRRTVVFLFRGVSEFTLSVRAVPVSAGQILEFAGWSEMVDIGNKIKSSTHGPRFFQQKFSTVDTRPAVVYRHRSANAFAFPSHWNWVPGAVIGLGLVALAGTAVSVARPWAASALRQPDDRLCSVAPLDEHETWHRDDDSFGMEDGSACSQRTE